MLYNYAELVPRARERTKAERKSSTYLEGRHSSNDDGGSDGLHGHDDEEGSGDEPDDEEDNGDGQNDDDYDDEESEKETYVVCMTATTTSATTTAIASDGEQLYGKKSDRTDRKLFRRRMPRLSRIFSATHTNVKPTTGLVAPNSGRDSGCWSARQLMLHVALLCLPLFVRTIYVCTYVRVCVRTYVELIHSRLVCYT